MTKIGIGKIKSAEPKTTKKDLGTGARDASQSQKANITTQDPIEQEGQLSVDVYQTDTDIVIVAPVAGTDPNDLDLTITEDVITIKGRRELPTTDKTNQDNYYTQECFWGNFSRSIVLPSEVDTSRVDARFKHNILTIRIPKIERIKTRNITIQHD